MNPLQSEHPPGNTNPHSPPTDSEIHSPLPDTLDNSDTSKRNLIVNYIPPSVDESVLEKLFSPFGPCSIKLVRDRQTNLSLCYAFVLYQNQEDASRAIQELNGHKIENKTLKVSYARPRAATRINSNLYVTKIPPYVTPVQFHKVFERYGTVINSKLLYTPDGKSKGSGFVRLADSKTALQAFQELNRTTVFGSDTPILIKVYFYISPLVC